MQSRSLFWALVVVLVASSCASKKNYVKDNASLVGIQLPAMVLDDAQGNRYSTFVFNKEEQATILVASSEENLKKIKKPAGFAWRMLDLRKVRPWYYPGFLYNGRFERYNKLILDDSGGLLDQLKLKTGDYAIKLERGKIVAIDAPF